jgi:hypothetical protein
VALFQKIAPDKALPGLLRLLHSEQDPVVLQTVGQQAEAAFPTFLDLALALDRDGHEAILLTRIARYMHHPELRRVLATVARSKSPEVREAAAELWRTRPDLVDEGALEVMTVDPVVPVRQATVAAWAAAGKYHRLAAMLGDPDPSVRRAIGRAYLEAPDTQALEPLLLDPDETVRAALFATRLLRGEWNELPAQLKLSRAAAADAVRQLLPVETLRDIARTERDAAQRLSAALALAVLGDEAALTVMRTDPIWAVRDRVGRMMGTWQEPPDARHSA